MEKAQYSDPSRVFLVTNAQFYKYFEYEAFGRGVPLRHIVNSGRSLGDNRVDWKTISLALRLTLCGSSWLSGSGGGFGGVLLIASDCRPPPGFALPALVERGAASKRVVAEGGGSPIVYFLTEKHVGLLLEEEGALVPPAATSFGEAVVPIEAVLDYLASKEPLAAAPSPRFPVGAMDGGPDAMALTPLSGPYAHALPRAVGSAASPQPPFYARGFARVGLLGNPSDGYGGKTLAVTIDNFYAEAWLTPLPGGGGGNVHLIPHPVFDPLRLPSLEGLSTLCKREGYSGGVRLMAATLHRLHCLCTAAGYPLDRSRGFTAHYHTTVPRQVGLAGSSAIITAFLKAAMAFYGIEGAGKETLGLTRDKLPAFVLSIESDELGITAGLQDRVVQVRRDSRLNEEDASLEARAACPNPCPTPSPPPPPPHTRTLFFLRAKSYECPVHMNFDPALIKAQGYGTYTPIPVSSLPPLFLAYAADPSDSGRIHAPIKSRWLAGDAEVISAMSAIANLADEGLALAQAHPRGGCEESTAAAWAALFTRNFNGRRALFGDPALGRDNIRMVEIARESGASAKFPGSGGAVVGVVDVVGMRKAGKLGEGAGVDQATDVLRAAYHREGYVFVRLHPHETAPL